MLVVLKILTALQSLVPVLTKMVSIGKSKVTKENAKEKIEAAEKRRRDAVNKIKNH